MELASAHAVPARHMLALAPVWTTAASHLPGTHVCAVEKHVCVF